MDKMITKMGKLEKFVLISLKDGSFVRRHQSRRGCQYFLNEAGIIFTSTVPTTYVRKAAEKQLGESCLWIRLIPTPWKEERNAPVVWMKWVHSKDV
jgi:hypothetical protein